MREVYSIMNIDNEISKRKSTCCKKSIDFTAGKGDEVGKCNGGSCLKLISLMYKIASEVIHCEH